MNKNEMIELVKNAPEGATHFLLICEVYCYVDGCDVLMQDYKGLWDLSSCNIADPSLLKLDCRVNEDKPVWNNGDECVWNGINAVFIGYSKSHGSRCAIEYMKDCRSIIDTVFIDALSKPKTEQEKLIDEVKDLLVDLFGDNAGQYANQIINITKKA